MRYDPRDNEMLYDLEDDLDEEFRVGALPSKPRYRFHKETMAWPRSSRRANKGGIRDSDELANIDLAEIPALITRDISASVGAGGRNRPDDVRSVQVLLNTFSVAGRLPGVSVLTIDGTMGPNTINAIKKFQRVFVGMGRPDGRVDPGGRTLKKLNGSVFQPTAASTAAQSLPTARISPEIEQLRQKTRKRFGIPGLGERSGRHDYDGWEPYGRYKQRAALTKGGRTIPEQMAKALEKRSNREALEATLKLFEGAGPIRREDIDVPLLISIAAREGGSRVVFSTSDELVVSAGRDTHPKGVSGLDYLYLAREYFPETIRSQIRLVRSGYRRGRENRKAALLPKKYLLAGVAVWIEFMEDRFEAAVRKRFSSRAPELLANLSLDAQRAWIALGFAGSGYVRNALRHIAGTPSRDPGILNQILTDPVLRRNFHVRGAIVTAARSWMFEQLVRRRNV